MEETDPLRIAAQSLLAPSDVAEEPETPDPVDVEADLDDEAEISDTDDEDIAEPEPEVPEQPKLHRVKVDGKEVEVTFEELTRGYAGQAYIQQGMKEAAAAKKEANALAQTLREEQQRFLDFAQTVQSQGFKPMPQAPNPALASQDPIAYIKAKAQYDGQLAEYTAEQAQIAQMQQANAQRSAAEFDALISEQMQILQERIPEFADPEKAVKVKADLVRAGRDYGYSDTELDGLTDARAVQVLHDAAQWRALQARTAKARVEAPAPRTVKPSAVTAEPKQVLQKKIIAKAKRTGDLRDWAQTLLE